MNKYDELTGTLVLVNPDLPYDPAGMQNQIDIITDVEIENDSVYVSFGRKGQAVNAADALLIIRNHNLIDFNAPTDIVKIAMEDFRDLLRVSILSGSQIVKDRKEAIEIARFSRTVLEYSMITLEKHLAPKLDCNIKR